MINIDDKMISMLLLNSHESDRLFQRPDKTTYVCQIRKNKPNTFYTPEIQLEIPLNLPKSHSKPPISKDAPHINILKNY